jgi:hypothetical protein
MIKRNDIAFFYVNYNGTYDYLESRFVRSFEHFHPDIHLIRVGNVTVEAVKRMQKVVDGYWKASLGAMFAETFPRIIEIDIDCLVMGRLDEFIDGNYEVAATLNNSDIDPRLSFPPYATDANYVSAGIVGASSPEFWREWEAECQEATASGVHLPFVEQDLLQKVFHSGKYAPLIVDENAWNGTATRGHWNEFVLQGDTVTWRGKPVRMIHEAGGFGLHKLEYWRHFSKDVVAMLRQYDTM